MEPLTICEECFGPLEPAYDLSRVDGDRLPQARGVRAGARLWRYEQLLPGGPGIERVDLGAGFTPLRRADSLAERLGLEHAVDQGRLGEPLELVQGPRGDRRHDDGARVRVRGDLVRVDRATSRTPRPRTPRRPGMPCYVFVPDDLERAKILATEAYGAKVVAVKGNYDDVNRLCSRGRRRRCRGRS